VTDVRIRDARAADFDAVLALNDASVSLLSPLSPPRLAGLHARAALHRVAEREGEVIGFLLAFREGTDYDSPNYLWFAERYPRFLYVDRVVVADAARGQGVGALLYRDMFEYAAASGVRLVTCEFDIDPPNPASERFHGRFGFREVGRQWVADGRKRVSLQVAPVQAEDRWSNA
jgi:predicted GNAT superfamily acetyltransferase